MGCEKGGGEPGKGIGKTKISADGWLIFFLVLWMFKGWDSELGSSAKRSEQCTCRSTLLDKLLLYWTGPAESAT